MDRQFAEVKNKVELIPEEDFFTRETTFPTEDKSILGATLVNFPLKFIIAYCMQLFLYQKIRGPIRAQHSIVLIWNR